ncbi:GTP pyrophosphokinase [Gorillibacterium massiliense]|uniref:GTP pyrophosphokinase n=1 Tax=Gorillibacterium massiliense TaxID=1280390 RepID=UPI0004BB6DF8|nr:GTP pyrophosphokinase family protein [Gorillibacterium massiliense]
MNQEYKTEHMRELARFMMTYKFALDEIETKINILQQEFQFLHDYMPIEHIKTRLKSPDSIIKKAIRKNLELSIPSLKKAIQDIAGVRITCSFLSDIYPLRDMLVNQEDIRLIQEKDYIKNPKPNGYQSLHLILEVPVFMSDRQENVCVEVQIRTIAMDFWASLEHKIFYKYNQEVPERLLLELKKAADTAGALDIHMADLHREIGDIKEARGDDLNTIVIDNQTVHLPELLMKMME